MSVCVIDNLTYPFIRLLESLELQEIDFMDATRSTIIKLGRVFRLTPLIELRLIDNKIRPGEMDILLNHLVDNRTIKKFHLTKVRSLDALTDFITKNTTVENFMLSVERSDDNDKKRIMMALGENKSLINIEMGFMLPDDRINIQSIIDRNIQNRSEKP